jgi:methanogenic corrinoid protein MtbC1
LTGLAPATLRAWEKRYGVPAPARTPSRYRLYSDADLGELRWMRARVAEGIPPRQAARLVVERREAGLSPDSPPTLEAPRLAADLKASCLAFDEDGALEVIRRAGTVMRPVEIMRAVVLVAVAEIGRDWEAGLVTVAQEHFASQLARRFGDRLMDLYRPASAVSPVLCACAPGERHDLGLLAVAIELRGRGIPVVYLGADVPVDAVLATATSTRAGLVVIGCTLEESLEGYAAVPSMVVRLESTTGAPVLWAGPAAGRAPAFGLVGDHAETIDDAVARAAARVAVRSDARA